MPAVILGSVMKESGGLPNEGFLEIRVPLYLLHPSAEGFSIHLRRYFQIARHNVLCDTGIDFCHFRKVNGQPPFLPPSHNVPELAKESKCEWHFEVPHVVLDGGRRGELPQVQKPAGSE